MARRYLAAAVKTVQEAVAHRPECGAIFNGGQEEVMRLLDGLQDGSIGIIFFTHFRFDAYALGHPGTEIVSEDRGTLYDKIDIHINLSRLGTGYWNQVGGVGRAKIILHEMGHVANL